MVAVKSAGPGLAFRHPLAALFLHAFDGVGATTLSEKSWGRRRRRVPGLLEAA